MIIIMADDSHNILGDCTGPGGKQVSSITERSTIYILL